MRSSLVLLLSIGSTACEDGGVVDFGDKGWGVDSGADIGDCVPGYVDADSDGYAGTAAEICDGSTVQGLDDCDDTDPAINPGTHTCGLFGAVTVDEAVAELTGDELDCRLGVAITDAGDLDGDGGVDLLLGAHQRSGPDGEEEAGRAYVVQGPVRGDRSMATAESVIVSTVADESLGASVSGLGDTDGDGFADIMLGTEWTVGAEESRAWLLFGPIPEGESHASEGEAMTIRQPAMRIVASKAGDSDGDGLPELALGAPSAATAATDAGAVFLVLGPTEGVADLESAADAVILGASAGDSLGYALASDSDPNGDGVSDLLVGAPGLDGEPGVAHAGAAYLFDGPVSGTITAEDASATRLGEGGQSGYLGRAVARAGDVDADGYDDLLISATGEGSAAFLLLGPVVGEGLAADAAATILPASDCSIGTGLAGGQDMDGDGQDDYAVDGCQVAHLFYEPVEGTVLITASHATLNVDPEDEDGGAGSEGLAMVTDADGRGTPGLLVGVDDGIGDAAMGRVWLYLGY